MPPSGTAMTTTNTVPRTTRADYHKEALHQIRASLQPFANGVPRERLSPVGLAWSGGPPPPTPPRTQPSSHIHHHHHLHQYHQPPSPHHHHYSHHHRSIINGNSTSVTATHTASSSTVSTNYSPSTASLAGEFPPPVGAKHYGYEPPPPAPPPRVPISSSSPPPPLPAQMPPILSRLSPSPAKGKTPNYVNVSASSSGLGPGRPMVVTHSAQGPPPPYPTHSKPPLKMQPPPYSSRVSPNLDRTSPGPTPPPVGASLAAGAMAAPSNGAGNNGFGHAARQAKTPTPVIMQSVRSTHVQKPVLQTAVAPPSPPLPHSTTPTIVPSSTATPPPPYTPSSSAASSPYTIPASSPYTLPPSPYTLPPPSPQTLPSVSPYTLPPPSPSPSTPPIPPQESPVPLFDPPSYHSTMQAKAAAAQQQAGRHCQYRGVPLSSIAMQETPVQELDLSSTPLAHIPIDSESPATYGECEAPPPPRIATRGMENSPRSASPVSSVTSHETHALSPSPVSCLSTATSSPSTQSDMTLESGYSSSSQSAAARGIMAPPPPPPSTTTFATNSSTSSSSTTTTVSSISAMPPPPHPPHQKTMHHSPIPQRKKKTTQDVEIAVHADNRTKYSPEAYKFYMEQHIENVIKSAEQRKHRGMQLEREMKEIGLSTKDQSEMRKVLFQKESNFIRLKRAKMDKSMFQPIKTIGVGAFGEVTLVRKYDCSYLYAMKTLRKSDIIKRNQMAHVKAERDILAESDNDWVVKLYYSFQDADNLYLIMDYIPGGDLMSLLIKFGIFKEPLARFYIAELVCAIESVHKMGFIHRDIKPDNILIDRDGHIKLTDFGLCTGFRWTHNSRYYQRKGDHSRQESIDPCGDNDLVCRCNDLKPLERRRRRQHLRCLAHSLVGTPNYIAPEVLARTGYSQLCDWWSVGVILYEMLVGQPPFLANKPAETQYKVLNWETTLRIPKQANMSAEAKDLILRLCTSPENRLGRNAQEIKNHQFFSEIDFEAGLRKQRALYIPEIKYPTDTSNFDPIEPDRLRSDAESDSDWANTNQPIHGFYEFTFRRFFDSTPNTGVAVGGSIGSSSGASAPTAATGPGISVAPNSGSNGEPSDDRDGQHPVYV